MIKIWFALFLGVGGVLGAVPIHPEKYFQGEDACVLLSDLKSGQTLMKFNDRRCAERVASCSTFKVALALMAIDRGLITDENTPFTWDGTKYALAGWNQNQTAKSWMKESTVWVSQLLAQKLGKETVEKYLKAFDYGTADMSGGIKTAWLTVGTPGNEVTHTSVLISPKEQLRFLTRLWKNELPVSKKALELTKKLTFVETSPKGYALNGKTGSGFLGNNGEKRLGWFIAHVDGQGEELVSVVNFTADKLADKNRYAGLEAREKLKKILTDAGKY